MTTKGSGSNGAGRRLSQGAVLLLVLAGAGCAAVPFTPRFRESYTIKVMFTSDPKKGTCAVDVDTVERNCDASGPQRCLRVRNGEKVTFQAVDAAGKEIANDFEVSFGPFKHGTIASNRGVTRPLTVEGPAAPKKPYPFNVYTTGVPGCGVVDPQIIIEY